MKWKNLKTSNGQVRLKDGVYILYIESRDSFLFALLNENKWYVKQAAQLLPVPGDMSKTFTHYARIVKPNEKAKIHKP